MNLIFYLTMEARLLLERNDEKAKRLSEVQEENVNHQVKVEENEKTLSKMFSIKSYVGDANTLNAISDLGKLKNADIPCRIEGGIVKMLYVIDTHDAIR
jgi:hypothetical protein